LIFFKRYVQRKLLSLILIGLILEGFISFVDVTHVFAQHPSIMLKWIANAGTGSTWMGPLAADLNNDGLMEIVITGKNGIAALDPLNGSVIWSQPYGGDHVPFEIVDLNKDGIPEIVMCPQYINGSSGGVLALHGNNGSVYWYNPNAYGKGTYIAVADINADGYPEIYSVRPGGISALTYDGRIFASTWTYYSCWGGLTIGDTDFDGVFELYLGERSDWYPSYPSGGRGLRAFWADNLTEIWCKPKILCSSQAPVLADVDKDGDLEIIILNQRGGIAVFNTDGSVNTYKGIYRYDLRIPGLTAHSNPPVADLDDDGNLELITCGVASHRTFYPPKIWDLVEWKLDATLPFPSDEPPGVADVDGDGKLEIINCNPQNVTIFKYNSATKDYDIIYTIPIAMAHPFSIAQDIDDDGKLELVFNLHNSWVYVYDVEAPAPTPKPRSGLYFYSQYRRRVSVYVPPPGPQAPKITEISPNDGAANVPVWLSQLSFKLTDYQCDPMNYTVITNPDIGSASGINVSKGKIIVPVSSLTYSTTYTWTVTATDGAYTTTKNFTFTTISLSQWYNTDWQYRKVIVIDPKKVAADQTNLPVVIDLIDSNLIGKAQADGDDFIFTDANNVKLNHEIELYNPTTGHLIAWVNVPYVSSTVYTVLYMYYGNSICPNQENPPAIWDTSHKLVLHLSETHECRFWGMIAEDSLPHDVVLDHLINLPYSLENLSASNPDGWGIAFYNSTEPTVLRGPDPAYLDPNYDLAVNQMADSGAWIGVAHIRTCSSGARPPWGNPHPFMRYKNGKWWAFGHNGNLDKNNLKNLIGPEYLAANPPTVGTNWDDPDVIDSDLYMLYILKCIEANGWNVTLGIAQAVKDITSTDSGAANFFLTDGQTLWGFRKGRTLEYYHTAEYSAIASQHPTSTTGGWISLSDYNLITLKRGLAPSIISDIRQLYPLLVDSTLDNSIDSADLRTNSPGQDWYESRNDDPTLLTLDTTNVGGNTGKKAALKSYGISKNAYLTQEFSIDQTGTFTVSFDIYIDRIEDSGGYDRTGLIYIGSDHITTNCPTGTSNERFVFMAFYDPTPGDTGNDLEIRARTSSSQSYGTTSAWLQVASGLSYDTWYTVSLVINIAGGTYDVYVNDTLVKAGVAKYSGYAQTYVRYISFSADSDGRGDFYVDNIFAPAADRYKLTIITEGSGSVVVNPAESSYASDSIVTLIASPSTGWKFSMWKGDASGSENPITIIMDDHKTIIANFTETLLVDSEFNDSMDSEDLRTNSPEQDWYESRNDDPTLLYLDETDIGGNAGKKAAFTASTSGNAYLSQEFSSPQTGVFTVQWDIYVDSILDISNPDRAGWMLIGSDLDGINGPNSASSERFVYMAFFKDGGGTSGTMGLVARQPGDPWGSFTVIATGLNLKEWYTIKLVVNVTDGTYDVYIDGEFVATVTAYVAMANVTHISFAQWNDGAGAFYVDNVFAPATDRYKLTVNVIGNGSVTINPSESTYAAGTEVTLTALADPGYVFAGWSGDIIDPGNPIIIIMDSDKNVTATFIQPQYSLSLNVIGNGTITKDPDKPTYNYGEIVTLTANSSVGWSFLYWSGDISGNQNPVTIVIDGDKTIMARFIKEGTCIDSTINANDGTLSGGVTQGATGKIDGGYQFDGVNDYIEIPHSDTLAGFTEALTVSFWIKIEDTSRRQTILDKYVRDVNQRGWFIEYNPAGRPTSPFGFYASYDGINYREWYADFVPVANTWYYVTIVWEANTVPKFYINGALVSTVGTATISSIYNNVGVPLYIARCPYDNTRYFKGSLDEIHISNSARSASYILTCYNNQKNPSTFYTTGEEESLPTQPFILDLYPADGATNIPITITELSFNLTDYQGDLMDYYVSTYPNIGGDNAAGVGNGRYSVPITGLEYKTTYTWYVNVTDGIHWTNRTFTFTTEIPITQLLVDLDFNNSTDSADLRANSPEQDWYESRAPWSGSDPTLLYLDENDVGGNTGKKAGFTASSSGNAYLTQEFSSSQTGVFTAQWDIYVDSIITPTGTSIYRAGIMLIGSDLDGQKGPSSTDSERFVFLAFHKEGGADTGPADLVAMSNFSSFTKIADVNLDQWYTIKVVVNVTAGKYDVYLDGNYIAAVNAVTKLSNVTHISFAQWNDGAGTFYIDNVSAFKETEYTLQINIIGSGSVQKNPDQATYAYGTAVNLTAFPDSYWTFAGWSGDLTGTENPTTILMDSNKNITATFTTEQLLLVDSEFKNSVDNNDLRNNTAGQDWYESRNDDPTLLTLNDADIGGNAGNKAAFAESTTGNAYLTQEFNSPQTETFTVQWDIYVESIADISAPDRTGWMLIGDDSGGTNGPNSEDKERFVYMAFYKPGGGTSGTMNLVARDRDDGWTSFTTIATGLNLKQWYTIKVVCDLIADTYDVYIDGEFQATVTSRNAKTSVTHISFAQWNDGAGAFYVDNVFAPATDRYKLTINVEGEGNVEVNPGESTYAKDAMVTLTATPAESWIFSGWSGDLTGTDNPATITMTKSMNITAHFTVKQYIINASVSGIGGTIDPSGLIVVYHGQNITFTITANIGYHIIDVIVDDVSQGPITTYTFYAVNSNHVITAFFAPNEYTLTINVSPVGSGQVIINNTGPYYYGDVVELTAVPIPGWSFSHWEGDLTGIQNPATITIDAEKNVTAVFTQDQYTLTINIIGNGTVTKNPNQTVYTYGTEVELYAVADEGWTFLHWLGDITGNTTPTTITMNKNKTVTAVFTQNQYTLNITIIGNGTVTKNPDYTVYAHGEIVTLTAIPDLGWEFSGWSGDIIGLESPVNITMNSSKTVIATFTQINYTLTINIEGEGNVTIIPDQETYTYGENVTLTAIPDLGWSFESWSGDAFGNETSIVITMDGNKSVTAIFTQNYYTLTILTEGQGFVSKNPDQDLYTYGDVVELNATADLGWSFSHWSGDISSFDNPITFTVTGNMTIKAHFKRKQYIIVASVGSTGGIIEPSGLVTVYYGENVTFTIVPDVGYHILDVIVDDISQGQISEYTFYAVTANHTITVFFAPNEYTLTVNVFPEGSGTITLNNTGPYYYGDAVQLTANSNAGWYFSRWEGDISGSQNPIIIIVDGDKNITAVFTREVYTLNIVIIGNGSVIKEPNKTFYTNGETVTLTAIAESGWTFSGWGGDLSGLTNPVVITITENKTVTATFTMNNWWCRDWQYRRKIIINHTKVRGELTDFPVLIEIVDSGLIGKTQPNGYDFVFTDANNARLNHQIEFYDSTTGHLIVWVKVPYLSPTEDTIIYMYYGNPTCENQQSPTEVWDTNYMLVLHLNEETGTLYDSTINENNATPYKGVLQGVAGKIDGAVTFDPGTDYIEIPHSDTLTGYTEAFTVSFWIRLEDTSRRQTILCKYDTAGNMRGWQIEYDPLHHPNNPFWFFVSQEGVTYSEWWASFIPQNNTWYYVTVIWQSNEIPKFYINGVQVPTVGTATISSIYNNVGVPLWIGRSIYAVRCFKGSLDEIRISNIARSLEWILTAYNNQLNPMTFYSLGEEETFQETYILTVHVNGYGSVTIAPEKTIYTQGENVTLTATPIEGYEFQGWSGDLTGTENPINITITKNMNITAHFTLKQYVINASVSGVGGTITPSGLVTVYYGENVTFTIAPDLGYHILDVIVDDISQGQISEYTFYTVDADHTIIAVFAPDQ